MEDLPKSVKIAGSPPCSSRVSRFPINTAGWAVAGRTVLVRGARLLGEGKNIWTIERRTTACLSAAAVILNSKNDVCFYQFGSQARDRTYSFVEGENIFTTDHIFIPLVTVVILDKIF